MEKAEVAIVEALRIKRQALQRGGVQLPDDTDVATTLEALALAYTKQGSTLSQFANPPFPSDSFWASAGRLDEAEMVYDQVMSIKVAEYGSRHWEVARTCRLVCLLQITKGHFPKALQLAESLVEVRTLPIAMAMWTDLLNI